MNVPSKQGGLTFIGFLMVASLVVCVVIIGAKLFPVYQEYYSVVTAMNQVSNEPGVSSASPVAIKEMLDKRLYTSYVSSVKKNHMKVIRSKTGLELNVAYEVRKKLVGNLDFVAVFDKTVPLN